MSARARRTPRVAVLGAGVIGQVMAARLAGAGAADVRLLARGERAERLARDGVRLRTCDPRFGKEARRIRIAPVTDPGDPDVVLVSLQAHQLSPLLPLLRELSPATVVPLMHLAGREADLVDAVGAERLVRAFPGLGGFVHDDGVVEWLPVRQQPTTVDARAPRGRAVRSLLARTGLATAGEPHMADWYATHSILIAGLGAGLVRAGGDEKALAADPHLLAGAVAAIRDGFRARRRHGGRVRPSALRVLFGPVPPVVAHRYWAAQLRGDLGRVAMAPHARASATGELPQVCADALAAAAHAAPELSRWVGPLLR